MVIEAAPSSLRACACAGEAGKLVSWPSLAGRAPPGERAGKLSSFPLFLNGGGSEEKLRVCYCCFR